MASIRAARTPAADPLWRRAQACLIRGQLADARKLLAPLQACGNDVHAQLLAAQIAWREDRVRDGARHALAAAQAAPDDPATLCTVVAVLLETGETVAARERLDRPALAACEDPLLLMRMAKSRKRLEQHAEALALLDRAKAQGNASAALRFYRGEALMHSGRLAEAETELAASLVDAPDRGRVAVPLVRLRRQTPERNYLAMLDAGIGNAAAGSVDQAAFEFARYKTLENLGRDDEAWQALAHGNALMHARLPDTAAQHHARLDRFLSAWPPANPAHATERPAGPMPIFIVGVPRSGTTIMERMLGNHSRVAVAGELMDFGNQLHWMADTRNAHSEALASRLPGLDYPELGRRYLARTQWRADGRDFFIDKQPPNWVLAAAIHAALPQAPILNLVRDPMDVCFSNWRAYFGEACAYSYDLDALADYFNDYRRAMSHWHQTMPGAILDVRYAELVREPDATLRKVFAFCKLEWKPGCSDIARNVSPSATLSAAQVRSPLHARAFGEWRRYETHLRSLQEALLAQGPRVHGQSSRRAQR